MVAVLGDVVASRETGDRSALQRAVEETLDLVNANVAAVQPLTPTIGDEFQGLFEDLDQALTATLWARLELRGRPELSPHADVRFGVGVGELTSYDAGRAPYGQDGPAWWAARDALEHVEQTGQAHAAPPGWRTSVRLGDDPAPWDSNAADPTPAGANPADSRADQADPDVNPAHSAPPVDTHLAGLDAEALINAFLVCRDTLVAGLDDRDARILSGCLRGQSQAAIAEQEAISASAVSQRLRRNGGYALLRSRHLTERVR